MGQTETKVAQITLKSESDRSKTISIDNPKDNLSLNQIKNAFQPAINGGWLIDNYGDTIVEVSEAKYNQVIKTQINGEPVVVAPNSLTVNIYSSTPIGGNALKTLTISGASASGISFNNNVNEGKFAVNALINSTGSSITIYFNRLSNTAASENFNATVYFKGTSETVTIPVSVTQEAIS